MLAYSVCNAHDEHIHRPSSRPIPARRAEQRLPPAISGQNNYWLWGPRGCSGKLLISVVGATPDEVKQLYGGVQAVGVLNDPYAMPFEHTDIYLLRDRHVSIVKDWPDFKNFF